MDQRTDNLCWGDYFMGIAMLSAQRSKDPSTQVGACVVDESNRIVGIGYNGFPRGCADEKFPWKRDGEMIDTKYPYVCHAELNAILNAHSVRMDGCTIFVTLFPCNECAKLIIQSGITTVVYACDKYHDTDSAVAARKMFNAAGIVYYEYTPEMVINIVKNGEVA